LLLTPKQQSRQEQRPEHVRGLPAHERQRGPSSAEFGQFSSPSFVSRPMQTNAAANQTHKDPEPFHRGHYKKRHRVENFFQRLKEYRAIATRYEKRAGRFEALVLVVSVLCW
jgi:hypothetical protein